MKNRRGIFALVALFALVAAACGGGGSSTTSGGASGSLPTKIGPGEGHLNLIAWPGYTQKSWLAPFEQQTGCQVQVKYGNTSDEMVRLMRQGGGTLYDGVSASGDASLRLIEAGDVAAINTNLIPDFKDAIPPLQSPAHNTVDGVHYGVPYMYGPNFLMYNKDVVKPAPTSWDVVWQPTLNGQPNPYAGKLTAYDSPIYIADAALYLKTHDPSLGITDPYELTSTQLDAAVALLKQQAPMIQKYWFDYLDEIAAFKAGDQVAGTAWPVNYQYAIAGKNAAPLGYVIPSEGVTGWADTWMMSSHAQNPNCMYMWMAYTMQPDVQSQVATYYGATPSNVQACAPLRKAVGATLVDAVGHCGDAAFLSTLHLWKTPLADCGNGQTDCTDYNAWTTKWTEVRGA